MVRFRISTHASTSNLVAMATDASRREKGRLASETALASKQPMTGNSGPYQHQSHVRHAASACSLNGASHGASHSSPPIIH